MSNQNAVLDKINSLKLIKFKSEQKTDVDWEEIIFEQADQQLNSLRVIMWFF